MYRTLQNITEPLESVMFWCERGGTKGHTQQAAGFGGKAFFLPCHYCRCTNGLSWSEGESLFPVDSVFQLHLHFPAFSGTWGSNGAKSASSQTHRASLLVKPRTKRVAVDKVLTNSILNDSY